ncbi:MAG TPA: hypothetical protein VLK32_01425 [Bacillota bacterium]|nr:hypothetical protein [Bacillota bacterium]
MRTLLGAVLLIALLASPAAGWSITIEGADLPLAAPLRATEHGPYLRFGAFLADLRVNIAWPEPHRLELRRQGTTLALDLKTGEVWRDGESWPGPGARTFDGQLYLPLFTLMDAFGLSREGRAAPPPPSLAIDLLGRSVLIRTPGGRSLLLDAGPEVTPEALWDLGVGRINILVVTAAEPGRTENLGLLLQRLPVDEVWDAGYGPGRLADLPPGYRLFLEELAARGTPYRLARAGERAEPEPGVTLEFLSPRGFRPRAAQHAVAARLIHGEARVILAGALDDSALARVRDWLGDDDRADVWLVGSPPEPVPSAALVLVGPQRARFRSDGTRVERLPGR